MRIKKESNGSPKADSCSLFCRIFTRFYALMCRDWYSHLRGRRPTSGPKQHLYNVVTLLWSLPWLLGYLQIMVYESKVPGFAPVNTDPSLQG